MKPTTQPLLNLRRRQLLVDIALGACIACAVLLLLLFAGTEDQGFIYVDF